MEPICYSAGDGAFEDGSREEEIRAGVTMGTIPVGQSHGISRLRNPHAARWMGAALLITGPLGCSAGQEAIDVEVDSPSWGPVLEGWGEYGSELSIVRRVSSENERLLIAISEFHPADWSGVAGGSSLEAPETLWNPSVSGDSLSGGRWWVQRTGAVLLPFALPRGAIEYYSWFVRCTADRAAQVIDSLGSAGAGNRVIPTARFKYVAEIAPAQPTFRHRKVFQVRLSMSFENRDPNGPPMSFSHHRFILITGDGIVLEVRGDGLANHRGEG